MTALDLFLYQAFGLWFEFDGHALVARYGRIDEPAPGVNAALQALRVFDAVIAQPCGDVQAADAVVAKHDEGFIVAEAFQGLQVLRHGSHGNQFRAGQVGDGVLFGFPHVDPGNGLAASGDSAGFFHADLDGRWGLAT